MYKELIEYYKIIRKSKGISQDDAGKLAGTNTNAIGRMERMENPPTLENFCKMAKGIGMMVVLAPLPKELVPELEEEEVVEEQQDIDWNEFNTEE